MEKMYSNIGKKLQMIAKICGVFGIICAVVGVAVACMDYDYLVIGISLIASGIASIAGSWPLYAFGQLTNDVHEIRNDIRNKETISYKDLPNL